jgi:LmbE family N-acetylglucosaminyl deacetylase
VVWSGEIVNIISETLGVKYLTMTQFFPYNFAMNFIYLSPHLDDAALSCGGLIWDQVQAGQNVEVWNIFAGFPPPGELSLYAQVHHKIWGVTAEDVVPSRRLEDASAMAILGARARNFDFPDAIYRKHPKTGEPMYTSHGDLFGGLNHGDDAIIRRLVTLMADNLPEGSILVSPLTVGNHVDHQLVRVVAELLPNQVWYYPEFPYTQEFFAAIPGLIPNGYKALITAVTDLGLKAWQESVAAYASQISTFWSSMAEMRNGIAKHADQFGGVTLWHPANPA